MRCTSVLTMQAATIVQTFGSQFPGSVTEQVRCKCNCYFVWKVLIIKEIYIKVMMNKWSPRFSGKFWQKDESMDFEFYLTVTFETFFSLRFLRFCILRFLCPRHEMARGILSFHNHWFPFIMPPFEEEGHIALHRSVGRYVGR